MARPIPNLDQCKQTASLLLKDLYADDAARNRDAGTRFQRIHPFKAWTLDAVIGTRDTIQRKHALDVVAREHGFLNWKKLKDAADVLWAPAGSAAYWHNWCKTHAEARTYLAQTGGYLLSAHGTCFIAEAGYIAFLGLDPEDPRWTRIGFDIVKPDDPAARDELVELRKAAARRATS